MRQDTNNTSNRVEGVADDVQVQVHCSGRNDGPALVVLNSLGASRAMWAPQQAWFATRYRLLHVEYPGHGSCPDPRGTLRVQTLAAAVMDAVQTLGITRVSLLGLSLGGMVALAAAAADTQDRIENAVIAHARWYQTEESRRPWDARIAAARAHGMQAIAAATADRWLTQDYAKAHPEQMQALVRMIASTSVQGYAACAAAVRDVDLRDLIGRVRCKIALISGRYDVAAPSTHMQALAQALGAPHITLNTAHLGNIEQPDAFIDALRRSLPGAHDESP